MANAVTRDLWFAQDEASGFDAASVRGSADRQLAAIILPITGGIGVNARIDGASLVLEFDNSHTQLSNGHLTTERSGLAGSYSYGMQIFPTVRGAISGQTFTYDGVEYTIQEIDYAEFSDALDIDITPRMASRDALDALIFRFTNSAGETVDFRVSDKRGAADVNPNGMAGSQLQFTTEDGFWNAIVTDSDWAVLEPIALHHFIPSASGAPARGIMGFDANTLAPVWVARDTTYPYRRSEPEDTKLTDLALDITLGSFGDATDVRLSPIDGQSTPPTLAEARAFAYRANGGRAHSGGARYENLWFALESETDYDFTQRVNRIVLTQDGVGPVEAVDITRLGLNAAGDRFIFRFRIADLPAGSNAEIHVQVDSPTIIRNVRIITDAGAQGQFSGDAPLTFERELYRRSSSGVPPAPIGGEIGANGWITLPLGWFESPDDPPGTQSSVLYFSRVTVTRNAAGVYSLGLYSLPVALSSFNIRYSRVQFPTDSQISLAFQQNPRSEYRSYYDVATGTWEAFQPIFTVEPWEQIMNYSFNVAANANKAIENRIVSIGRTIDLTAKRFLWIRITGRRLSSPAIQTRVDRIIRPLELRATASNERPVEWFSTRDVQEYLRLHAKAGNLAVEQGPEQPLDLSDGVANEIGLMMSFIGASDSAVTRLGLFRPASRNVQYTIQAAIL